MYKIFLNRLTIKLTDPASKKYGREQDKRSFNTNIIDGKIYKDYRLEFNLVPLGINIWKETTDESIDRKLSDISLKYSDLNLGVGAFFSHLSRLELTLKEREEFNKIIDQLQILTSPVFDGVVKRTELNKLIFNIWARHYKKTLDKPSDDLFDGDSQWLGDMNASDIQQGNNDHRDE